MGDIWRRHAAPLGMWTLLFCLFWGSYLLGFEQVPESDLTGQFHAFALAQTRALREGQLLLWSPGSYGGFPFVADIQSGFFYPLRWLTIVLALPLGELPLHALIYEGLLHAWLCGVGIYALVWDITATQKERLTSRPYVGFFGAVGFVLGGYLTSYPFLQLAILETVSWLPWVLVCLRRLVHSARVDQSGKGAARWMVLAGVLLGLCALVGHTQTLMHVAYVAVAYFLFLVIRAGWHWRSVLLFGCLWTLIALGIFAAAAAPTVEYTLWTTRSETDYDFVSTGLPLIDYLQVLVPDTLSLWQVEYAGLAVLVLAVVAVLGRGQSGLKAEVGFWLGVLLVAAVLSLGDKGILFALVHRVAPGFGWFRQQERLAGVFSFALVMLGSLGLVIWLEMELRGRRQLVVRAGRLLVGALLVAGVALAAMGAANSQPWLGVWLRQWVVLVLVYCLLYGGAHRTRLGRAVPLILIAVLAVDLSISTINSVGRSPRTASDYWPRAGWMDVFEGDAPGRLDAGMLFFTNAGEIHGWEDLNGISPLKSVWAERFEGISAETRHKLLNVTHIVSQTRPDANVTVLATMTDSVRPTHELEATLFRYEDALPRARLVFETVQVENEDAAIDVLVNDGSLDVARQAVVHTEVAGLGEADPNASVQVATEAGRVSAEVSTQSAGLLVISEWLYPGWRATVDGVPVEIVPVNAAQMGVVVPAGVSAVEVWFRPNIAMLGASIALLTLVFAAVLAWCWRPQVRYGVWPSPLRTLATPLSLTPRISAALNPILDKRWFLPLVVLAGFALRMHNLGVQDLRGDEAYSAMFARVAPVEILRDLLIEGDTHPPLHYLSLHVWMEAFGYSEFVMRLLTVLVGVLLVPLVFQLGRVLAGRRFGLLVAVFVTLSQSLIWLNQDVRSQYAFVLVWSVCSTILILRLTDPSSRLLRKTLLWVSYALLAALHVYSHYYGFFVLLAHGLLFLNVERRKHFWRWVMSGVGAAALFAPWALAVFGALQEGNLNEPSRPELATYLVTVGREMALGPAIVEGWTRWLFMLLLAVFVFGAVQMSKRLKQAAWVLLAWVLLGFSVIFLVLFTRATFNAYYIAIVAPAWWLLFGYGVWWLWRRREAWAQAVAVSALVIPLVASAAGLQRYFSDPVTYGKRTGMRELAMHVLANEADGDLFVYHFPDPATDYYFDGFEGDVMILPTALDATEAETVNELRDIFAQNERVWIVPFDNSGWDPTNSVIRWLDGNTVVEEVVRSEGLRVAGYRGGESAEKIQTPINTTLSLNNIPSLTLEGVYLTRNGTPIDPTNTPQIASGETLRVNLFWQGLEEMDRDLTVFVQLLEPSGVLAAQHDGIPSFGNRRTQDWPVGERIMDPHDLLLGDVIEGDYRLIVGLYDTNTGERQMFDNGSEFVYELTMTRIASR